MKKIDGVYQDKTKLRTVGYTVPRDGEDYWVFVSASHKDDLLCQLDILQSQHIKAKQRRK